MMDHYFMKRIARNGLLLVAALALLVAFSSGCGGRVAAGSLSCSALSASSAASKASKASALAFTSSKALPGIVASASDDTSAELTG